MTKGTTTMANPIRSDNITGRAPLNGLLRDIELGAAQTDAEALQRQDEYLKATEALKSAENRLEMAGRNDLAVEVRKIRARFMMSR
jgi:hypothetical protein